MAIPNDAPRPAPFAPNEIKVKPAAYKTPSHRKVSASSLPVWWGVMRAILFNIGHLLRCGTQPNIASRGGPPKVNPGLCQLLHQDHRTVRLEHRLSRFGAHQPRLQRIHLGFPHDDNMIATCRFSDHRGRITRY